MIRLTLLVLLTLPSAALADRCIRGRMVVLPEGAHARVVESRGRGICIVRRAGEDGEAIYMEDEIAPHPQDDPRTPDLAGDFACVRYGFDDLRYVVSVRRDGTWARSDVPDLPGIWRAESYDRLTLFGGALPMAQVVQQSDGVTFVDPDDEWVMVCPRQ